MLGSTVARRLRASHPAWRVEGTSRDPTSRLSLHAEAGRPGIGDLLRLGRYDYVINCIGVLRGEIDERRGETIERAIRVNALFPHEIADVAGECGTCLIHISTDAVFSGRRQAPYTEADQADPADVYGMTKSLGETPAANALTIRCSLVGRDTRGRGLVEWYRASRADSVAGFSDYVWTPATTVQVADACAALVGGGFAAMRAEGHVAHFAPNPPLSKADFLCRLRNAAGGPAIEPRTGPEGAISRVLVSRRRAWQVDSRPSRDWPAVIAEMLGEFSSRGA